jgi:alkaline phosphatase
VANARVAAALAGEFHPPLAEACRSRALALAVGGRTVGTLPARAAGDLRGFRTSLEFDRAVADLAIGLLRELKLGQGTVPDVLAIGLSATDYVGHSFGVEGAEMCAQLLGVDANVGRILAALDESGVPYVVALTADHGGHDLPERNRMRATEDAVRVDPALAADVVGRRVAAQFGLADSVLLGEAPFGDLYLSAAVPQAMKARVLEAARRLYASHPQVAAAYTAAEVAAAALPSAPPDEWTLLQRFRVGFDAARSGDLLVALKPHVTPIADPSTGYVATHGSPWNYDRRVPILFYQAGRPGFEQPLPVDTVDILPTLAALIHLPIAPGDIDGRCLNLGREAASTCGDRP